MKEQNYANHHRYVPLYHFGLFALILLTLGGACHHAVRAFLKQMDRYDAALVLVLAVIVLLLFFFCRIFALKAQDRAIRAEENLRHFVLAGKLLDPRLNIRQIIGLRFASDGEFVDLAARAAEEGLSEDAIKQAVKNWKADYYRV